MIRIVISRLFETYFRHRWLYLLPVMIMVAASGIYLVTAKPKYVSKGILYIRTQSFLASLTAINNNEVNWWLSPAQATANDINELLQTDAFVRAILQQTDLEAEMSAGPEWIARILKETRTGLWVNALGENQIVLNASHESPVIAHQLVNAMIEGFIQWNINSQRGESETAQQFFTEVLQTYEADLVAARNAMAEYLTAHPEPLRGERSGIEELEIARLQDQIDLAATRYSSALDKEENARLALVQIESDAHQTYTLIDAPRLPEKPETTKRQLALNIAIFLFVGVFLSFVGIAGAAVLDRSFRFTTDIQNTLNMPVLAVVPDMTRTPSMRERLWAGFTARFARKKKDQPGAETTNRKKKERMPDPVR